MKLGLIITVAAIGTTGCVTPWVDRGQFTLLAPQGAGLPYSGLSKDRISSEECFDADAYFGKGDNAYEVAVNEALSQHPGATVLLEVQMEDTGRCVLVSGIPAK